MLKFGWGVHRPRWKDGGGVVSDKKKVYIETSVISNLTSRPSMSKNGDILDELWEIKRTMSEKFSTFHEFSVDLL